MTRWPVKLRAEYKDTRPFVSYNPMSDYFLAVMGVPVIIVEVRSKGQADDHNRMLVQGASLVQLANGILVKKGKKPDFVLVAIYFDHNGIFRRYLIYQDEARVCGHIICMVPIAERTRRTRYCVWRKHSLTSWKTGFGWFTKCTIWFHNRK